MISCKFCGKTGFKQLKTHERQCPTNPTRTSAAGHVGKNHYTYGAVCSEDTRKKISEHSKKQRHSEETKKKISIKRKQFLLENPDMVPYKLNHSSTESYPEKYFGECFANTNVVKEYGVCRYSLDFANPEEKVYFEVDGEQHYLDPKIVEHDIKRAAFLDNAGWTMYRVRWSEFQKLDKKEKDAFVTEIKIRMKLKFIG